MQVLSLLAPLLALLATVTNAAGASYTQSVLQEETLSLDQLHMEAIQEGGNLVVYHGGDTPTQQDWVADAFRAAFPKINLTMVVDYSKYHNVRIDNQLETNTLAADVVALQTLQDYPRWKKQNKLLNYKPTGFSQIYQGFVDPDGAWASHVVFSFSHFYDKAQLNASGLPVPKTVEHLANPIYRSHITSTYPHDDDAVLFLYAQYIEKYGWDWLAKMAQQNIQFERGSNRPGEIVDAKQKAIGLAAGAASGPTIHVENGNMTATPYLSWGQRIAILKKARHPAAAKLFVNWAVSMETQTTVYEGMSCRTDVNVSPGQPLAWEVPQANSLKFQTFMEDRAAIESLKFTLALYFGEVQGEPSPGKLGMYPGK